MKQPWENPPKKILDDSWFGTLSLSSSMILRTISLVAMIAVWLKSYFLSFKVSTVQGTFKNGNQDVVVTFPEGL